MHDVNTPRRHVLVAGALAAAGALGACASTRKGEDKGKDPRDEMPPGEDLMREHGVLRRLMLIYDDAALRLETGGLDVDPGVLSQAAGIVKSFIEDYHEKSEEELLFPRFDKSSPHKDLVTTLRMQHAAGRRLTEEIRSLSSGVRVANASDRRELASAMRRFNRMYRPHADREDTVLYPALRTIVSASDFDAMGDEFEKREHDLFGEHGFEDFVEKVAALERKVGLYDLGQFTPQ